MTLPAEKTLLILNGMGIPLYSARGLTQTIKPIESSKKWRRNVNGLLVDVSAVQMRKYITEISCTDQNAPAIDGIWPGMEVQIYCVCELALPFGNTPGRPVVPDSLRTDGSFSFYRPILQCLISPDSLQHAEYPRDYAWTLTAEEK